MTRSRGGRGRLQDKRDSRADIRKRKLMRDDILQAASVEQAEKIYRQAQASGEHSVRTLRSLWTAVREVKSR